VPNSNGSERDTLVEERRQAIIDAAIEIVAEYGVENLTLRKVARRLNATTGLVTHYFSGREELVIAALNSSVDRVRDHIVGTDHATPEERIKAVFASSLKQPTQETANWPFRLAYAARAAHSPVLRDHYRRRAAANRKFFSDQVRELQKQGRVDPGTDAEDMGALFLAVFNGLGTDVTLDEDVIDAARAQEIVSLLLHSLARSLNASTSQPKA